jgi:hypothetical protein
MTICKRRSWSANFTCFRQIILKHRGNNKERCEWKARYFINPEERGIPTVENCEILLGMLYKKLCRANNPKFYFYLISSLICIPNSFR